MLRFTVRDTGIGIPAEKQSTIFRAFEQEDMSTTRKYGGTGLGLTISAQLAALMGGTITVQSEAGRGSTFTVFARFGLAPPAPTGVTARPLAEALDGVRVLVVDDNAANREIMQSWLRRWQMDVTSVGDSMTAMDALWHGVAVDRPYALVLLDARMPDGDGLVLAGRIRERHELCGSRIVLLSSSDRAGDVARERELRVDGHLLKPIQQDELLEMIYHVLSGPGGHEAGLAARAVRPSAVPQTATLPPPHTSQATMADVARLRVLVAEDNEFNAYLMEKLLSKRGHSVRVVGNGREAFELASAANDVDLLLLDIHMAEMDGFEVIRAIRERERTSGSHLPVIALTARSRKEDMELCLAAGMDAYLSKPVRADDLWEAIERVTARSSSTEATATLLTPKALLAACGGDDEILRGICDAFRANSSGQVAAIKEALHHNDAPRLREAAHKWAGMVSAFSTMAGGLASDLEDLAAGGQLQDARALVEGIDSASQRLVEVLAAGVTVDKLRREVGTAPPVPR
jgi:CheY-like chemotaxis protein/HPt (histidine-containing phosphotransfer) domain-containing protein